MQHFPILTIPRLLPCCAQPKKNSFYTILTHVALLPNSGAFEKYLNIQSSFLDNVKTGNLAILPLIILLLELEMFLVKTFLFSIHSCSV